MAWLKANWKGVCLFILSVAALITMTTVILLRRTDSGFITKDDGAPTACGDVRWVKALVPVPVLLDHNSKEGIKETAAAITWWNAKAGFTLFEPAGTLAFPSEQPKGTIVVEVVSDGSLENEEGHVHGLTSLNWIEGRDHCSILRAHVKIPGDAIVPWVSVREKIARHELGHALGLDHDGWERSVMYQSARFELDTLTEKDRTLLNDTYK